MKSLSVTRLVCPDRRVSSRANVKVDLIFTGQARRNELGYGGKSKDPNIEKYAPEVIVEGDRIFQPENKNVSR